MSNLEQILKRKTVPAKIFTIDPLKEIELIIKIETALKGNYSCIGLGIQNCIDHGVPAVKIIREIKEMGQDNYCEMVKLLSGALVDEIINY